MGQRGLAVPYVVAIGASAGGIKAIPGILSGLPEKFPAPILIVQHVARAHPSHLAEVLRYRTSFPISEAEDGRAVEAGHAYVGVENRHLIVDDAGCMRLTDTNDVQFARPSVDVLFTSLAHVFRDRVIAVVLSGGGTDGTGGAHEVRKYGGYVIAQSLGSSEHRSMPRSVQEHGDADEVLALEAIAERLIKLTSKN